MARQSLPNDAIHLRRQREARQNPLRRVGELFAPWLQFWTKLGNDWIFNLSGLLAYNLLMTVFPIALVLLAAVGFLLGGITPQILAQIEQLANEALPGGGELIAAIGKRLSTSALPLLIIGVITAALSGAHLFVVMENCFGVIFQERGRDFIHQNLMAYGMLLLYVVLVPLVALASIIPPTVTRILGPVTDGETENAVAYVLSLVGLALVACVFFGALYLVVPNRPLRLREIWPGTLLASALFVLYEALFPVYIEHFFRPDNYGSLAGFAIVLLLFFYYLGFILLLGAELNSWIAGIRPTGGDPAWMYHEWRRGRSST